jgi:transcriptional regulator PpsR
LKTRQGGDAEVLRRNADLGASPVKHFEAPKKSLVGLDPEAAATLIAATTDVALVLDRQGVIRDLSFGSAEMAAEGYGSWIGQPWVDTVTVESRPKVEALLREAAANSATRWRHVNHPSAKGADVPVLYSAIQVGKEGGMVVVGRDLRSVAALQQRLVSAQQSMERDYWRLRHVETRYRLLFDMSSEAVLIIDAATMRVVEANPAAGELLEENVKRLVGRVFPEGFDAESTQAIRALFGAVRSAGRSDELRVSLASGAREFLLAVSVFRQENNSFFLVRLARQAPGANAAAAVPKRKSMLLELVDSAPDGFVVTDLAGRILTANRAFIDLAQIASEELVRGESLERWLGRPGVDLKVLVSNLRQHGAVQLYATTLLGEFGTSTDVEISAVSAPNADQPCLGFTIRNVGRRLMADSRAGREMPRSVEQLTELVGRVSLKDLVRESTDLIERLCIEAALDLTGDNRASAAEMLGLSRQSLYVKLRRYGLGDLASEEEH